jgi:hypothetical protein
MSTIIGTNVFGLCQIFTPSEPGFIADGRNQGRGCSRSRTPAVCDRTRMYAWKVLNPGHACLASPGLQLVLKLLS